MSKLAETLNKIEEDAMAAKIHLAKFEAAGRGSNKAGTELRLVLQEIKSLSQEARNQVQSIKVERAISK